MSYTFTLTAVIPASPQTVYDAWLDSRGHSQMTGGEAKISAEVGSHYRAWDGYISGENVELVPGKRIVQSWRTTQFTEKDPDSKIVVTLAADKEGTRLTLEHINVPDRQTSYEKGGWQDHYFTPMQEYFAKKSGKKKAG